MKSFFFFYHFTSQIVVFDTWSWFNSCFTLIKSLARSYWWIWPLGVGVAPTLAPELIIHSCVVERGELEHSIRSCPPSALSYDDNCFTKANQKTLKPVSCDFQDILVMSDSVRNTVVWVPGLSDVISFGHKHHQRVFDQSSETCTPRNWIKIDG